MGAIMVGEHHQHRSEPQTEQAASASPAMAVWKAAPRQRRRRDRLDDGRMITSMPPKVWNRDESPAAIAKRASARKRSAELRQRRKENADRLIGSFAYDGRLLTLLAICIRPHTQKPYLEEEAIALGQSEFRPDLRKYDLALRAAVTAFIDDVVQGRVAL